MSKVATQRNPTTEPRGRHGTIFRKSNRECASIVPWLLQEFFYQYPKYRTARSDYPNGDTTTPPLTTATPVIEEGLVRDVQTNEVYLPLTSKVVLKRKQQMLYVPLDFEDILTVDALVDSGAFVSAIA